MIVAQPRQWPNPDDIPLYETTTYSCPVSGAEPLGNTEQEWGHVTVRRGAHMFWWLYYTTADVSNYTERPLIIWLQGGPGMPSSGYGNFLEIGPLDINFQKRNYSLIQDFNILFIDNPVGVGYSYVADNDTKIPKSNEEIGEDLFRFLKIFMNERVDFQKVPLYIFGESYGGKMVVEFACQIAKKKKKHKHKWNLKGIGLGNSYISPLEYIRCYASLAHQLVDFEEAADVELTMMQALVKEMPGVDVYNFISRTNISSVSSLFSYLTPFTEKMNTAVKTYLSIEEDIEWTFLNNDIYESLNGDLLKSVARRGMQFIDSAIIKYVSLFIFLQWNFLLNNTNIKIIVYNGALDFLVNTAGTRLWMEHLRWKSKDKWKEAAQEPFSVNSFIEGYVKKADNLLLYVIFRAGHSVPIDNMPAFREMLIRELVYSEMLTSILHK
ncbi:hypothetical protein NQ318_008315 [Aromia moschata]|uniref:Carboxypeptidase n=1 Tax=Aromia moschata TaxID=1265417 RepID=A0AAV8XXH5_9CUCU|nr:hypothetical protein NQ318_008315 [Aromia moschata]